MALPIIKSLKDICNWVKSVADYPVSIENLPDTIYKNQVLTKYKSGKLVYEAVRKTVTMKYTANGNRYIDYMTVTLPDGFINDEYIVEATCSQNNTSGSFYMYPANATNKSFVAYWCAPVASPSAILLTNVSYRVTGRWKNSSGGGTE